jgi:hypothetical protein
LGGAIAKIWSSAGNVVQGCLLRVQIYLVGGSQEVSSSVPARARTKPSLGVPQTQEPHSGRTKRVLTRPLSAVRWIDRGSIPLSRKAFSATTIPIEKALLFIR